MKIVTAGKPRESTERFAPATIVETGRLMFTSGLVARDAAGAIVAKGDMRGQARQIFANLADLLHHAGATPHNLVKLTYFVTDMARWEEVADARKSFLGDARLPSSTTVEITRLFDADCMIEIEAVAELPARAKDATP